ncbi:MAG: UDP-2,3-diacylglucosamine diphosphatase [Draconibacterium sp.]|nr:UDP-2,3-diacylglucosamine diphosphatase [Draconibacterium sp.]
MTKKGKIYFISDVHLGAPASKNNRERELLFAKWLDEIKDDVAELYLLGDIFDFWWEYKKVVPRGFTRILGRIADLADSGVDVHFFTGNHDLWAFEYLSEELGVKIHHNEIVKEINGKKFFLAHGDGLDADDKGYILLKKIFTNKALQWVFSRLHPNFAFALAHKWSKTRHIAKINIDDKFDIKNEGLFKFAENFLEKEIVDYLVFGHRHVMINTEIGDNSKFVILGDWIKYFSYGVFDGDKFELKKYKE